MNTIEDVLIDIVKHQPQWNRLVAVVDLRVEKIFGILKPEALREYRAVLTLCGWPPSLTSLLEKEGTKEPYDTILSLHVTKGDEFSMCFSSLCALQHLHDRRQSRKNIISQTEDIPASSEIDTTMCLDDNLWAIDELVTPLVPRIEHHFSKWTDQPKFIFSLAYKIAQDFLEVIDNVLQPLMDLARLVRYSAKEAWVSAMVKMLSTYLRSRIFPVLSESYEADVLDSDVISSWLNLVDLIIEFDKQMQALVSSGTQLTEDLWEFSGGHTLNLLVSIFNDHAEWLRIWTEIELRDVEEKLKLQIGNDKSWKMNTMTEDEYRKDKEFLLSTREDYKAPLIADSISRTALSLIERSRAFSSIPIRVQFIKSSACVLMNWFYMVLHQRYEENKSSFTVISEEYMLKLVASVNAAKYCESVMQGWTDDVIFLDISEERDLGTSKTRYGTKDKELLFYNEIESMIKLETDCLLDIVSAILHDFDSRSRNYIHVKQNLEYEGDTSPDEGIVNVSSEFIESLDFLIEWLGFLRKTLNPKGFADLWRSVAGGLDHFIFNSIVLGSLKFGQPGVEQFKVDMKALFLVFRAFCLRPEAFFPCINDSLKLMEIKLMDVELLLGESSRSDKMRDFMKSHSLFHLTPRQAKKIIRNTKKYKSVGT